MKITRDVKNLNHWRVSKFRHYKFRPYTLDCYEQDLRNFELRFKIFYIDNDKIFQNLVNAMLEQRIKNYENLTRNEIHT